MRQKRPKLGARGERVKTKVDELTLLAFAIEPAERNYAIALSRSPAVSIPLRALVASLTGRPQHVVRQAFRKDDGLGALEAIAAAIEGERWPELLPELALHRRTLDLLADQVPANDPAVPEIRAARVESDRVRNALVQRALFVARRVALRYRRRGVELEDLVQEATVGLLRAADRFDAQSGFPFEAYGAWWARQQIQRALVEHTRTIRVPLHVVQASDSVKRAERSFSASHGRVPTAAELLARNVDPRALSLARETVEEPLRLDGVGRDGAPLGESVPDSRHAPADDAIAAAQLSGELGRRIERLTPRHREVVRLRFGLEGSREHTLQEIGDRFGISRERVRRIEGAALDALGESRAALGRVRPTRLSAPRAPESGVRLVDERGGGRRRVAS